MVQVNCRWRGRRRRHADDALLVVEKDGRRHRFAVIPSPRRAKLRRSESWCGCFALPSRLAPRLEGNTALMLGDLSIPLPPGSFPTMSEGEQQAAELAVELSPGDGPLAAPVVVPPMPDGESILVTEAEPAISELLGDETAAALRAELQRRTGAEAALRGKLTDVQAELDARAANQDRLERAHRELGRELETLRSVVAERDELLAECDRLTGDLTRLRSGFAASEASRESALSEVRALRKELERLGAELAAARAASGARDDVAEAQELLRQARELRMRMRVREPADADSVAPSSQP